MRASRSYASSARADRSASSASASARSSGPGSALRVGRRLTLVHVHVLAIDERDDVGVLLEGAGFSQVGELRAMIGARLWRAAQLREQHDRHAQLLGQPLQRARDRTELEGAVL